MIETTPSMEVGRKIFLGKIPRVPVWYEFTGYILKDFKLVL
jgi:hypothetical protein